MAIQVKRSFAVFDIDGTLIRWQLYHAVADELARHGHFEMAEYEKVRRARMHWKTRASETSFNEYEQTLISLVDEALSGISVADFRAASQAVLHQYKDQVYTYTRNLIRHLKQEGYLLFAVSASHEEIVRLLSEYYGFDDYAGSEYEIIGNHFTGVKKVLLGHAKPERLQTLIVRHNAIHKGSVAVGDSESDIPMLEAVEQPIAFNPSAELYEHARSTHWKIVVERKNVIYELAPTKLSYKLTS